VAKVEALPGLYFIERGYLNGNHFVLPGDEPVLIDTAYAGGWARTKAEMAALGVEPEQVRLIITTHTHCDHIGGNRRVQEASGCDIALHPAGAGYVRSGDTRSTWWSYYCQEADSFTPTRELADGETINVGPYEFTALHTPGHASDGIVLYHPKQKVLISSDTLWEKDLAVITLGVEGDDAVEKALASLERLAGLEARAVFPGHGPAFSDFRGALSLARQRYEAYLKDPERVWRDQLKRIFIYTLLMQGAPDERRFFERLMDTPWFPETAQTLSADPGDLFKHTLGLLMSKGLVSRGPEGLSTIVPA
jgi:glyoxylase-like metal-dependent hydrolase (beta-lactamase superfamily II)